jgi:hypothetical protein
MNFWSIVDLLKVNQFWAKKSSSNIVDIRRLSRTPLWSGFDAYMHTPPTASYPVNHPDDTPHLLGTNSISSTILRHPYITIHSPHTYIICRRVLHTSPNSREPLGITAPLSPSPSSQQSLFPTLFCGILYTYIICSPSYTADEPLSPMVFILEVCPP